MVGPCWAETCRIEALQYTQEFAIGGYPSCVASPQNNRSRWIWEFKQQKEKADYKLDGLNTAEVWVISVNKLVKKTAEDMFRA